MPGTDQRISLLTTSEHDYKVLPQLRIPMVRTTANISICGLLAVQSPLDHISWPPSLSCPVAGDWVGEAIKL